ncbi:ABC transporter substrate-binding protein [Paenibacillus sp. PAMC21692]|uniref:ABC transporter substrate-binding protein n=1 Tax=Paenibacillus sp. PAMC21692 TaxID=2762320 RepID=UPI00164DC1F2|nr:ABC transporter substrate-binding protein [Paenibacillus sp. PAMC21692]QNK56949.1 ABC transporter substrate-binding protein [Paenibacillus sp. PAMC21692]
MNRKSSKTSYAAIVGLLSLFLFLSACSGNAGSNNGGAPSASPTASPNSEATQEPTAAFPRTIEAANGSIVIEKQPERVAVVHWGYIESILVFDLKTVGLALPFTKENSSLDSENYKPYVDKIDELAVVGENTTVNMESLLEYGPDLIIAGNAVNAEVTEQLEKIATTVVIDEAQTDVWTNWPALVAKFGEMLGQETVASDFIAGFENKIKDAKEKLADVEGGVAFLQIRDTVAYLGGTQTLTPYYDKGIGLKAPEDPIMTAGAEMSLEGLAALNPDHLFLGYFNYDNPDMAAVSDEWEKTEVWKGLKAVKNGQVYGFNGTLGMGYGPIGQSYGIDTVVEALDK